MSVADDPSPWPPDRWDRAIDMLQRAGDFAHTALLEAARAGLIDLVLVSTRKASLPFGKLRKAKRPVLVLIGDDDDDAGGPESWLCARQITQWARGALVHGSGARYEHYRLAVSGALVCQRFLVVDTASRHAASWAALLGHVQTLVIVPPDGEHPIKQPPGLLH